MNKYYVFLCVVAMLAVPASSFAIEEEVVPYQLAILYPFQVVGETASVQGFRFNFIYGVNENVTGVDFGLINRLTGIQKGLQFGIINSSFKTSGVQIGIINKTEFLEGLQIGFLNIHNEGNFRYLPVVNFAF